MGHQRQPRRQRFRVAGSFNGAPSAQVDIVTAAGKTYVSVRPRRSRRCFALPLPTVARLITEHPEAEDKR